MILQSLCNGLETLVFQQGVPDHVIEHDEFGKRLSSGNSVIAVTASFPIFRLPLLHQLGVRRCQSRYFFRSQDSFFLFRKRMGLGATGAQLPDKTLGNNHPNLGKK